MKWWVSVFLLLGCSAATQEDPVYQRCLDQMQISCERLFECAQTRSYATQADCTTAERLKCETVNSLSACDGRPDRYSESAHVQCLDDLKAQQCSEVGSAPTACSNICRG